MADNAYTINEKMTEKQKPNRIAGLYAITPDVADTAALCSMVLASIEGGVKLLQYRNKIADPLLRLKQAQALLALCREHDVKLIINDHIKLCLALDADGVHVGAEDITKNRSMIDEPALSALQAIRTRLGPGKLLGVSCYNQLTLAREAEAQGADYVAFGACFPSSTKPDAVHAPLSLFTEARQTLQVQVVAIGGIQLANAGSVIQAGADAIAVINALWDIKGDIKGGTKSPQEGINSAQVINAQGNTGDKQPVFNGVEIRRTAQQYGTLFHTHPFSIS